MKVNGYRGIWYELGKSYEYGDKYSGGFGTYTANHMPLAVYSSKADKTFFVYGGTTDAQSRYLLCMVGAFDHKTGLVSRPTLVHDKGIDGVNDPHDNPALTLDGLGYIWVFVAGRNDTRDGMIYRSQRPYDIRAFERVMSWPGMTYPQPWADDGGFAFFYTRYTQGRELYFSSSRDGYTWDPEVKLAGFGGHYQVSALHRQSGTLATCFNYHPDGDVDRRTNIYYMQSIDGGRTWTCADGITTLDIPLRNAQNPALVIDYAAQSLFVYTCDFNWDSAGNPVLLYVVSPDHRPGPVEKERYWCVAHWDGQRWQTSAITTTSHNYDMGSLYVEGSQWRAIIPARKGAQVWGAGGEVDVWTSDDNGSTWACEHQVTTQSSLNHSYIRRPVDACDPFYAFWADGHAHELSPSHLYFCDRAGQNVYQLPYTMLEEWESPFVVCCSQEKSASLLRSNG